MKRAIAIALLVLCAALPALAQRRAAAPSNPFEGNLQAVDQGRTIYGQSCTACHGANGGAGDIGPAIVLSNTAANLRGERSDAATLDIVRKGVPGTAMPAFAGKLSDDDILKLGAYIHSLRGTAIDSPLPGDPAHGEAVFWGKGQCGDCHMISGRGGVLGPDLTDIASSRKSGAIIDALTKPDHRVFGDGGVHMAMLPPMDSYDPVHVVTADGHVIDGVLLNQDGYSLDIMGTDNKLHLLDRAGLRQVTIRSGSSLMPTDYDKRLSPDEFEDLLAFLTRQGHAATTKPASATEE
jgi:cytochrome c oxidase cbb3-type subunit 3